MTENEIIKLIEMNRRLLVILGFGTSLIFKHRDSCKQEHDSKIQWFMDAIENVVYQDKPLPEMP